MSRLQIAALRDAAAHRQDDLCAAVRTSSSGWCWAARWPRVFGVEELTGRAINISTANLRTIETFVVVAVIYMVLTLRREHLAGAGRTLGISRQGEGVLMFDRLLAGSSAASSPATTCCSLLQAMGRTLADDVIGCGVGLRVRAVDRRACASRRRRCSCRCALLLVAVRRDVPSHSVPGHPVRRDVRRSQALIPERLAVAIATVSDLPAVDRLPVRDDPRRARVGAAAADRRRAHA